ncbi:unnamed protein product, partial [Effrenium voratum]
VEGKPRPEPSTRSFAMALKARDAEELRLLRIELMKCVQKSPCVLAEGRRAGAPAAAEETLKAAMSRARDLLGTCASLEDVKTSLAALEEASLWVLDPGTSSRQPQE